MRREFRQWEIRPPKGPYLTIKFSRPVPEALARQFARKLLGTVILPDRTAVRPLDMNAEVTQDCHDEPAEEAQTADITSHLGGDDGGYSDDGDD
jgi:hypothetical protein